MKKIISAILSLSLLAGVAAMPVSAAETYSLGDVDMNGVVDSRDAVLACAHHLWVNIMLLPERSPLTEEQIALANVYQSDSANGEIDIIDATSILSYYVYTLVTESPVASDEFFANYAELRAETEQAENVQDAADQAIQECQNAYDELH